MTPHEKADAIWDAVAELLDAALALERATPREIEEHEFVESYDAARDALIGVINEAVKE